MASDDLLTVSEAAELLGVSASWVYQRTRTGQLPVIRLGDTPAAAIRFRRADLETWLDERKAA